ncbi:cytochrome c [Brevundimonas sp.]|uniref:c-type cytochrome n=1 Tax=Brevundimonas sp. TaxID=1871086 RepID=UPI0025FF5381|nr:cytochrome c [Brevundimonas sp.]
MALILIVLAMLAGLDDPPPSADLLAEVRGHEIAQARCATCHAVGRDGGSPDGEAPAFRDLPATSRLLFEDADLRSRMTTGHPVMPDVELSEAELADLTAYLRSLERETDGVVY